MVNYEYAKIYGLGNKSGGKFYIGSTCNKYLSKRLSLHVNRYKKYCQGEATNITANEIIKRGDYYIYLIESVKCNNIDELRAKERYHIELNKDYIVNKNIAGRTCREWAMHKNNCECGGRYTNNNKNPHKKTKKHIKYMASVC